MKEDTVITAVNSAGYPAPAAITADPVVFAPWEGRLAVLLAPRRETPYEGQWALPGGFMNPEEEPEETAQRKLTEKTGIGSVYLEQLATYGSPRRDPRGWIPSVAYLALTHAAVLREKESEARWFPADQLPDLAFDHARIIADGIDRLRGKLWYSNIAVTLLPRRFTLVEARRLYEAISDVRYEVSNFRRTLEQAEIIRPTEEVQQGLTGRPARLYEFVEQQPSWSSRRSRIPGTLRD
ncbi:MAG TPA: NUDIX domain-containing protein [Chloroflexota bacterium]